MVLKQEKINFNIAENIKSIRFDIGLSYCAPNSAVWLTQEPEKLHVIGVEPNPECINNIKQNGLYCVQKGIKPFHSKNFQLIEYALDNVEEPQVQQFYADNFGIDLDEQSIFLGALDPTVGEDIVSGKITAAQIGGEAARAGFTISLEEAQRIQRSGLTQAEARRLFTQAQTEIPRIQELQTREGRQPAEQFGLEEFTEAAVFQSPEELEEIRRLEREEQSRFAPTGGAARQGRRVTGLVEE